MIFFYIYLTSDGHANTIISRRACVIIWCPECWKWYFRASRFHTVGYSSLTSCLLQILLKPLSSSKTNWNQSCLAFTYFPALCIGLSHLICLIEFWSIGLLDCVWFNLWLGRVSTLVLFLWHYWKLLLNHIDEFLYLILAKYKQSTK